MRVLKIILTTVLICLSLITYAQQKSTTAGANTFVKLHTNKGDIVLKLYNDTPLHKANFIKLVKTHFYDSILFHRVISKFMIQAGDPESKNAPLSKSLGKVDLPYTVPAEFTPQAFHKRGALGAARDGNIARSSSSTQFYIVQGKKYTDKTLQKAEGRINKWLAQNAVVNRAENAAWASIWNEVGREKRTLSKDSLKLFNNRIDSLASDYLKSATLYKISEAQRAIYKTRGGAAHLDQNYTVFGEVTQGMDIVDIIAAAKTNPEDRPLQPIRILNVTIVEKK